MGSSMRRFFRKYHKWFSLTATLFILFFAISGMILNHRELLSRVDLNRKLLPPVYRYNNWNLAAVKGAEQLGADSTVVFGNIGVWLTDRSFRMFTDMNCGFPPGIDNRKINTLFYDRQAGLYAGTLFGLYRYDFGQKCWQNIPLPSGNERIVKILRAGDSLMVMSRSLLMVSEILIKPAAIDRADRRGSVQQAGVGQYAGATGNPGLKSSAGSPFHVIPLPQAEGSDGKVGLFRTFWVLHSGEIYGLAGKLIVDAVGLLFILLCVTGLIYFFVPYRLKQLKDGFRRAKLQRFNKLSLKWHNVAGSWAILILILTTFTGMFLRPPLLIPIASSRISPIPYSELDNPNPWFDKLRDLHYDAGRRRFLIATNEGLFETGSDFRDKLHPFALQPPVSVMGINVLEKNGDSSYLVGSFSGIFEWNPMTGGVTDHITKLPFKETGGGGPPFGSVSVAGYIRVNDSTEIIFDYARGVMSVRGRNPLPPMPPEIIAESPVSLWNTALEIHTGRIFQPLIGEFYILVVPLVGMATLFILVSGFFSWWLGKRNRGRINAKS